MNQSDQGPAPRRPFTPLKDRLGELCDAGKQSAEYLWQVPDDAEVRKQIADTLALIQTEVAKSGRREMGRLVEELQTAIAATPSPQQAEILQDGFDRLSRLWQAAKSGLF
ncbi:MAG TPA: hypothetical protein VK688_03480 [Gemmatimonadales bacterium]|jgi:hypothetical protein|nr:hypothetical protein [Gemmatimonadales bacterium]